MLKGDQITRSLHIISYISGRFLLKFRFCNDLEDAISSARCQIYLLREFACAIFLIGLLLPAAAAQNATIDDIANQILDREIQLQKLNAQLHLEAANPSFNRARRTWLWDIGNALPTEGGLIAATALFYSNSNDRTINSVEVKKEDGRIKIENKRKQVRNHIPACKVAGTIIPQIAGQVVGGTGALFELGADYSRSRKLHKDKLDSSTLIKQVLVLCQQIDELQTQYDAQLAVSTNPTAYGAESAVLKDIKRTSLLEFKRLETAAAKIAAGQIIEDGVSLTRNTIGATGNAINVAAIFRNNKRLNGQGAILNLIAASLITTRPIMSNVGCYLASKLNEHRVELNFPELKSIPEQDNSFNKDMGRLESVSAQNSNSPQLANRLAIYRGQTEQFVEQKSLADIERKKSKQTIVRRFRETIYGPTKMAQSIMNIVIGFRRQHNSTADNRLAATANVTYTSGQAFNIAELLRERIVDESEHNKLKRTNMLPEQRIKRSLQELEVMQSQVRRKKDEST